jgi:isocitrate lyase
MWCCLHRLPAAGLKAIYLSGWQVAGDANTALQTYPDQSLYPADSVPKVVERINNAFQRADQIQHSQGKSDIHWFAPIVVSGQFLVVRGEQKGAAEMGAFQLLQLSLEAQATVECASVRGLACVMAGQE